MPLLKFESEFPALKFSKSGVPENSPSGLEFPHLRDFHIYVNYVLVQVDAAGIFASAGEGKGEGEHEHEGEEDAGDEDDEEAI